MFRRRRQLEPDAGPFRPLCSGIVAAGQVAPPGMGRARQPERCAGVADAVAWPPDRVRGARRPWSRRPGRARAGRGLARRGRDRQVRAVHYVAERSQGCRVIRAVGVDGRWSCPLPRSISSANPFSTGLERLPTPQREALETAFGLSSRASTRSLLRGAGPLSQLSELADARPLVCLVDDAQWLDRSSAQVLSFVARRLHAESVVIVLCRARRGRRRVSSTGLPELRLRACRREDASEAGHIGDTRPLDKSVRGRIIAEAHGNPLALLELSRWSSAALAGGFAVGAELPCPSRSRQSYRRRIELFPSERSSCCCWRRPIRWGSEPVLAGCRRLGHPFGGGARRGGRLLEIDARVGFRHPLLRRRSTGLRRRRAPHVHRALAYRHRSRSTLIVVPGTARRPRSAPTTPWPPSSSGRLVERRLAVVLPLRPPFCSARSR